MDMLYFVYKIDKKGLQGGLTLLFFFVIVLEKKNYAINVRTLDKLWKCSERYHIMVFIE